MFLISTFRLYPQHTQTVELGGLEYRLRLTYRHRLESWYLDLYERDGTPLALGRRLTPQFGPLLGLSIPDGPPGKFIVVGDEPYERDDLGDSLLLVYVTPDELPESAGNVEGVDISIL